MSISPPLHEQPLPAAGARDSGMTPLRFTQAEANRSSDRTILDRGSDEEQTLPVVTEGCVVPAETRR
jgi:hypothetical protein